MPKSFPALACLVGVLAFGVGARAAAHEPTAAVAATDSDIESAAADAVRVVDAFGEALKANRIEEASRLLAEDVLVLESGGAERSRAQYLAEHAGADAAYLQGAEQRVTARRARVLGELAWVGTETRTTTRKDGKPRTSLGTETMVLRRTGAGWRIVHIHWSSRPGP
jgi:ketosteroid isomerase-like protein